MGTPPEPTATRLHSLDQFRGYTVLGMFIVNFLGSFHATPAWLKHHHTYCSYADTIMPQFLFAVGFAYRLTFLRRRARDGARAAYLHAIGRGLGLVLLGVIVYRLGKGVPTWADLTGPALWTALGAGLKRDVFQALTHIGVTCLWALPVIALGARARVVFALASGLAHLALSWQWYYVWVNTPPNGIDGGPLGFLTWTIPLIAGTLTCDAFLGDPAAGRFRANPPWPRLLGWGLVLMLAGYALSCLNRVTPPNGPPEVLADVFVEPPFVPPSAPVHLWTMSQRSGSLSYLTFSAGLSLVVFLLFWALCDLRGLQLGVLRTLGVNALVAYVLHDLVSDAIKPYAPRDSPILYTLAALGLFLLVCYICLRHLEKHRLYLKL
jgi:predicted acyltransferase